MALPITDRQCCELPDTAPFATPIPISQPMSASVQDSNGNLERFLPLSSTELGKFAGIVPDETLSTALEASREKRIEQIRKVWTS